MADTTRDFNLTRNQIIESALRKVGALSPEEAISAEQISSATTNLNLLIKSWHAKGVYLWTIVEEEITVDVSTSPNSVVLDEDVLGIDAVHYIDGNSNIPVQIVPYRTHITYTDDSIVSNHPSHVSLGHEKDIPTLYVYPSLSADLVLKVNKIKRLQDMDTAGGEADVPQRFIKALVYGLAADMADDYGINLKERGYLSNKAEMEFAQAKRSDREYSSLTQVQSSYPGR